MSAVTDWISRMWWQNVFRSGCNTFNQPSVVPQLSCWHCLNNILQTPDKVTPNWMNKWRQQTTAVHSRLHCVSLKPTHSLVAAGWHKKTKPLVTASSDQWLGHCLVIDHWLGQWPSIPFWGNKFNLPICNLCHLLSRPFEVQCAVILGYKSLYTSWIRPTVKSKMCQIFHKVVQRHI